MFVVLCLETMGLGSTSGSSVLVIFCALMESLFNVVLAIGFGLNEDKISEMKNIFCCKKEGGEQVNGIEIETLISKKPEFDT